MPMPMDKQSDPSAPTRMPELDQSGAVYGPHELPGALEKKSGRDGRGRVFEMPTEE